MKAAEYLKLFWEQYQMEVSAAHDIYHLFLQRGEQLTFLSHDHLALRTFNDPRVNIDIMMRPFIQMGYTASLTYDFPLKKLFARHYEPPKVDMPKIFISELLLEHFSADLQRQVKSCIDNIPKPVLADAMFLPRSKTNWELDFKTYDSLAAESEYASWVYAYGFRANHFAIRVNNLKTFANCKEINDFLRSKGYRINEENGEVKGSAEVLLEQSSIMAQNAEVEFNDGTHLIPSCYYEFTHRFPDKNGVLYPGFVAASADKLFESTNLSK